MTIQNRNVCAWYMLVTSFFNFQTVANISKCHMTLISQSKLFVSGICLDFFHSITPRDLAALGALWLLRTRVAKARPSLHHPSPLLCAAPQSPSQTGPPDEVCPAQTPAAIGSAHRRCFPSCPTRQLHLPVHVGTCCSCADGAGAGWSE